MDAQKTREVLDYSISSTFTNCHRLAFYKYVLNRESKLEENVSISFGNAYHLFREYLEKFYRANPQLPAATIAQAALSKALENFKDPPLENKKSYLDTSRLIASCELALEKFLNEKATKTYNVLHTEQSFDLPLPSGRRYGGKFDQIIEWNKRLWVRDFKSTGWKTDWAAKYELDHQMSGYVWAAEKLTGERVAGVLVEMLYNIQKVGPEIYPILVTRTTQNIEAFLEWAEYTWDEWERAQKESKWPMFTTACFNYMKKCAFHGACSMGTMQHAVTWLEDNSTEKVWDFSDNGGE